MDYFSTLLSESGTWGYLILLFSIPLIIVGIVFLFLVKSSRAYKIYLGFSFLPLVFGIIGYFAFKQNMNEAIQQFSDSITLEMIEAGRETTLKPLIFGYWNSLFPFLIGALGFWKSKKR